MGKFPEAEQSLGEAEDLCSASPNPACGDLPTARGVFEMARGHYSQAQVLFERALGSARASGDPFVEATALLNLSYAADEQAHFDEALDWAGSASRIAVEQDFADLAQSALGNMGWAYYKLGDSEKAEAMFMDAQKKAEKLSDFTDQLRWITTSAYARMDAGDVKVAEQSFRQALDLAEKLKSRGDIINSRIALAFVAEQTGKFDEAKKDADEALRMAQQDGNKRDEVYPRLVLGRLAARRHDIAAAESAFHEVEQSTDGTVSLKWQAEHSLARLYEDENQPATADREYKTALSTFEDARKDLRKMDSKLPFLTNATAIYDDYIHFLVPQGKKDEALRVADFSRARTLSEGMGSLPHESSFKPYALNASQVARTAGGTILFYWLGEKQSYLWAITPQKTDLFALPPASEVDAAVQRYRKALTDDEAAEDQGAALYQMLVAPAHDAIASAARSKSDQVFVIPDGTSLNNLNFETLIVPDSHRYWIEDVTISNANSLRLLASSRNGKAQGLPNLLLVGDAAAASPDYPPLPKAALEIDSVKKHFAPAQQRVIAHEQATPPAYLDSKPEQFSYIHFVAHGKASRMSPLESAIVLSKATTADDSFKLYARDIIHHRLRADLVTVSACTSAGSRAYSGEGLVGLSWAFLAAGAHNVIGALWEVSDVSTPQLMDRLYEELKKGKTPAAALRLAKLSLLHSEKGEEAFRKPFYWAPFQLYTGS